MYCCVTDEMKAPMQDMDVNSKTASLLGFRMELDGASRTIKRLSLDCRLTGTQRAGRTNTDRGVKYRLNTDTG